MIIDIGSTIIATMGESLTLTRRAGFTGYDANGFAVYPAPVDSTIVANVQPTSPKAIDMLPEGERAREAITLTTLFPLITADAVDTTVADFVTWHGKAYKAIMAEDRLSRTNHFHTVCTRQEP